MHQYNGWAKTDFFFKFLTDLFNHIEKYYLYQDVHFLSEVCFCSCSVKQCHTKKNNLPLKYHGLLLMLPTAIAHRTGKLATVHNIRGDRQTAKRLVMVIRAYGRHTDKNIHEMLCHETEMRSRLRLDRDAPKKVLKPRPE